MQTHVRISATVSLMANIVVVLIVIWASLQDYFANSYKQVFFTPSEDRYFFMEDYGQSIKERNTFAFDVRSCSNVHILLMKDRDDFDEDDYEIVIGENDNSLSIIRKGKQNDSLAMVNHQPLDCRKLRTFWFSWENSTIKVGTVTNMTLAVFLSFFDENLPPIHFFSVSTRNGSTGHWVFDSSDFNNECCSYEAADCQDILDRHNRESGVYRVTPTGTHTSFDVYCDMDNDPGGWLVFQRRLDGSENFYRNWENYTNGFGNPLHEFWLGNDHLHAIVSQGWYILRIVLEDLDGNKRFANYEQFKIEGPAENYKLTIGGYSGDAGDSLSFHQGAPFSTYDRDNDFVSTQNCAERYDGAWWYSNCHHSNLNGLYLNGSHTSDANGVNWMDWLGHRYSLKATEMKIRRK